MSSRDLGNYILQPSMIGKGSFAEVYHGYRKKDRTAVAIKRIRRDKINDRLMLNLSCEIDSMRKINHPHIVKLFDVTFSKRYFYLVMELCQGGDLASYMKKEARGRMCEKLARRFLRQLAEGLRCLHRMNLVHRDLKPQNILLSSRDPATCAIKVADFGFAREISPNHLAETMCGSPLYMAPEVLNGRRYDEKVDLWSVGVIVYEMLTGNLPFPAKNIVILVRRIHAGPPDFPSSLSGDAVDLLRGLLQRNPRRRMTHDEFFSHPYVGLRPEREGSSLSATPPSNLVPFDLPAELTGPGSLDNDASTGSASSAGATSLDDGVAGDPGGSVTRAEIDAIIQGGGVLNQKTSQLFREIQQSIDQGGEFGTSSLASSTSSDAFNAAADASFRGTPPSKTDVDASFEVLEIAPLVLPEDTETISAESPDSPARQPPRKRLPVEDPDAWRTDGHCLSDMLSVSPSGQIRYARDTLLLGCLPVPGTRDGGILAADAREASSVVETKCRRAWAIAEAAYLFSLFGNHEDSLVLYTTSLKLLFVTLQLATPHVSDFPGLMGGLVRWIRRRFAEFLHRTGELKHRVLMSDRTRRVLIPESVLYTYGRNLANEAAVNDYLVGTTMSVGPSDDGEGKDEDQHRPEDCIAMYERAMWVFEYIRFDSDLPLQMEDRRVLDEFVRRFKSIVGTFEKDSGMKRAQRRVLASGDEPQVLQPSPL